MQEQGPSNTDPNVPPTQASQQSVHRFTQCSTLSQSTCSGVPCLSKGGKKFVTMTNLRAAVAATSKKKKATKGKKAIYTGEKNSGKSLPSRHTPTTTTHRRKRSPASGDIAHPSPLNTLQLKGQSDKNPTHSK
ncbi:hypothetical protein Salat_1932900 [Sesamum alatum]|uniref:Uncharacterized protein n=1 Tax=Sesamum alatum TaxID=300844 RepID=A0AAE2CIK8_9LAMI|nr:hypothetical protein Salat_1932900 [Sesamum alatum]